MEQVIETLANKLKGHILNEGVCTPYILKFTRCKTSDDFIRLGLHPQSIHFVIDAIEKGVITVSDIQNQLPDYINGKYVATDIIEGHPTYSSAYYCGAQDQTVLLETNAIHLIECSNITIEIPPYKAPLIYVSNNCKDIKIKSQGLNVIQINLYDNCNIILDDIKTAKSVSIYKFGKKSFVRNKHSVSTVQISERKFKVF